MPHAYHSEFGDYPHLCSASGEGVVGGIGEGRSSDEDGAEASQQEIGAVAVDPQAELSAQAAQPADGRFGPSETEVVDDHGGEQDQQEEATHALQLPHAHVFDIQAVRLIEAVGVLDLGTVAPVGRDRLRIECRADGDSGEEDAVAVQVGVVRGQHPQRPRLAGQADLEPTDLHCDASFPPCMVESDLQTQPQRSKRSWWTSASRLRWLTRMTNLACTCPNTY